MLKLNYSQQKINDWFANLVFCSFVSLLIFGLWCYIHRFCIMILYIQLNQHATAIALLLTVTMLLIWCIWIWLQIWVTGPGYQPVIPTFKIVNNPNDNYSIKPPRWYPCDPNGYPLWCSVCKSVKYFRSHHSHVEKRCVLRMDHYCQWLHCTIGHCNHKFFIQFTIYFSVLCIFTMVTMLCFIYEIYKHAEIMILLVASMLGLVFTGTLSLQHMYFISNNITSLEYIQLQSMKKGNTTRKMKHYVAYQMVNPSKQEQDDGQEDEENVENYKSKWYIFELTAKEYYQLFDQGSIVANWKDCLDNKDNNFWQWWLPISNKNGNTLPDKLDEPLVDILQGHALQLTHNTQQQLQCKLENNEFVSFLQI